MITTRKQAYENNQSQYYTGKPCKNGHTTYRYTRSGTCAACVAAANHTYVDPARAQNTTATKISRTLELQKLATVKVRAYFTDWPAMRATIIALTILRHPIFTELDLISKKPPKNDGVAGIYTVLLDAEDIPAIRELENQMWAKHRVDFSPVQARIQKLTEEANRGEPPPLWTETP